MSPPSWGKIVRGCCLAWAVSSPSMGFFLILAGLGYSLSNYAPAYPNDEIAYFLQAQTFKHSGFGGGYYGVEENIPRQPYLRTGVHGPVYPILYGTLGKLFGLPYYSAFFFHLGFLTLACVVYVALARPTNARLIFLGLILLSYWPLYTTLYSWMQDPLHIAIAIVLGGLFTALLRDPKWKENRGFCLAAFFFLCAASLLRISWAILFPPFFLLLRRQRTRVSLALAMVQSIFAVITLQIVFRWICAPYPGIATAFLMNKLIALEVDPAIFWPHIKNNCAVFFGYFRSKDLIGSLVIAEMLIGCSLVLSAVVLSICLRRRSVITPKDTPLSDAELWFHAYNLWATMIATVLLYYVGNGYYAGNGGGGPRLFSAHLLVSILVALPSPARWMKFALAAVVAVHVGLTPYCLGIMREQYAWAFSNRTRAEKFNAVARQYIVFRPGEDGWANTLLADCVPSEFAGLPAGIGLQIYFKPEIFQHRFKSRYVITTPDVVRSFQLNFKPLLNFGKPGGSLRSSRFPSVLYLNLNFTPPDSVSPIRPPSRRALR